MVMNFMKNLMILIVFFNKYGDKIISLKRITKRDKRINEIMKLRKEKKDLYIENEQIKKCIKKM